MTSHCGKESQSVHEVNGVKDTMERGHELPAANRMKKTFKSLEIIALVEEVSMVISMGSPEVNHV